MSKYHRAMGLTADSKSIHWVTVAARRIVDGEDFDAVMQDLAQRNALHSVVSFNAVKRELEARVEEERRQGNSA